MLILDVREHVQDRLHGARIARYVHKVPRHDRPERHDAPAQSDDTIRKHYGADGGGRGGEVGEQAVRGRGREVVVSEAVAEDDGDEDECGHWVEALDLGGVRTQLTGVMGIGVREWSLRACLLRSRSLTRTASGTFRPLLSAG